MFKKFICIVLSAFIMLIGTVSVGAASKNEISLENMAQYYNLINGCSKTALKNYQDNDTVDVIAYCGLDLNSPKIMFYLSMYYFANDIDFEKITSDPEYCTQKISELDSYLSKKKISNSKASTFSEKYQSLILENKINLSTVGAYTFKAEKSIVEKILDDSSVDFVIVGTGFMLKQGDINADGKINQEDTKNIQLICAEIIKAQDSDEKEFIDYACDLDENEIITINDATALQQNLTA